MPDALRSAFIEVTLRDTNVISQLNMISGSGDEAVNALRNLDTSLVQLPTNEVAGQLSALTGTTEEYTLAILEAQASTSGFGGELDNTASESKNLAEKIGALSGSFAAFGHNINTVMNWLDRYEISMLNIESAQNRLENAQMRYNEVLKKYGENNEDTKKAANELQNAQNALDKANLRANSSMVLIGISAVAMVPQFISAGASLVTFARTGQLAIAGLTLTVNANTVAHAANSAATWAASGARAFLTTITSASTYAHIANALAIGAVTAATWLWSIATWSVAIPLLAIEAPIWAIMLAVGGLILIIQDLYTWLTGGESVIGTFIDWLTSIDFSSVIEVFKNAGKFLLDALLRGMTFGLIGTDTLANIFGTIRDYLPFSDAKVGPLSDLTTSGQKLIQTFGAGAESQQGYLSSILGGLFKLPEAALGLAGSVIPGMTGLSSLLTGGTSEAPAAQSGNGIVVNVSVSGNTISGDEKSLKTLATTTAGEVEKVLMKILNQEASRA